LKGGWGLGRGGFYGYYPLYNMKHLSLTTVMHHPTTLPRKIREVILQKMKILQNDPLEIFSKQKIIYIKRI
jgi:hypothetical protein